MGLHRERTPLKRGSETVANGFCKVRARNLQSWLWRWVTFSVRLILILVFMIFVLGLVALGAELFKPLGMALGFMAPHL